MKDEWRVRREGSSPPYSGVTPGVSLTLHASRATLEIDEPTPDVHLDEPHADPVPDVESRRALDHASLYGRMQRADPDAFLPCARHQGIELLADSRGEQEGGGGLADLALDLVRGVLLLRAVLRQLLQIIRIRRGPVP